MRDLYIMTMVMRLKSNNVYLHSKTHRVNYALNCLI